ncbi:LLM class flavin-dependent oxidoreductase, partial [Streptomyces sp. SM12]|uniref:LLM class flavin-dependent oxidoreductase n=1 Tax=Streptomyces sp. SM12 TaxID=1071602 RepID=UPI000CD550E5
MIPLSVLDVAIVPPGGNARETLLDVVHVAQAAEQAGYRRFWVAEHHNSVRCAGSAPAVLMAHLAAVTEHIRIGSGGVMLTNHAPLVIAEQFAVLQTVHAGRIDLGVGRATGGNDHATLLDRALRRSPQSRAEFPELIDELAAFLHDEWPEGHPFAPLKLSPLPPTPPQVFVLGSSENGGRTAAGRGLPFVFGGHLGARSRPAAVTRYRSEFTPGPHGPDRPYVIASVSVLCARTDEEAERLAFETTAARVRETTPGPLSEARERYLVRQNIEEAQLIHGSPATVAAAVERLAATWQADEMMVVPYDLTGEGRVLGFLGQERVNVL